MVTQFWKAWRVRGSIQLSDALRIDVPQFHARHRLDRLLLRRRSREMSAPDTADARGCTRGRGMATSGTQWDAGSPPVVVFEGIDGAGKSSLARECVAELSRSGVKVELSGIFATPLGIRLREVFMDNSIQPISLLPELLLLGAASCAASMAASKSSAQVVLMDRSVLTTLAYHGGGLGHPIEELREMLQPALGLFRPSLVVLVDVSVATSRQRSDAGDRIEALDDEFRARVRAIYREIVRPYSTMMVSGENSISDNTERVVRRIENLIESEACKSSS